MQNPLNNISYHFSLQSAIDEGFAYERKHPRCPVERLGRIMRGEDPSFEASMPGIRQARQLAHIFDRDTSKPALSLSPKQRKHLMEDSMLETPRNKFRALMGVLKPYAVDSSPKEKAFAAGLLATVFYLSYFSVGQLVDFSSWLSGMTNTVVEMVQIVAANRPAIIDTIIDGYPMVRDLFSGDALLNQMLLSYPDMTKVLQDDQFKDLLARAPELKDALTQNQQLEDYLMHYPGFAEKVADHPELLDQIGQFKDELGQRLKDLPSVKDKFWDLADLCGGETAKDFLQLMKTAVGAAGDAGVSWGANMGEAWKDLWSNKDMAAIALKFTTAYMTFLKASQLLALRWSSWETGYLTSKITDSKTFLHLKRRFNNIDNFGQRIQEDVSKFTGASVSLLTGVAMAGMTLQRFGDKLWEMGPVAGVPGGFFWVGAAFTAVLLGFTAYAGKDLPNIYHHKQRTGANLRRATDNLSNNAEQIALTNSEHVEKDLIRQKTTPAINNANREINAQLKLTAVDGTLGNTSIGLPYITAAFTVVAAGTGTMGTVSALAYAFNRVTNSMSYVVNNFEKITNWFALGLRLYGLDRAADASYIIERDKREASEKLGAQVAGDPVRNSGDREDLIARAERHIPAEQNIGAPPTQLAL